MKVVIIGTGNVATVLGRKITNAGNNIIQVVGRNVESANYLGSLLNSAAVYSTRYINPSADIYVVAVSDEYLPFIAAQLKLKDKIVVHTAAAVSIEALRTCSENYGVLYPLQTLHKSITELPAIPVFIDGNNPATKEILITFSSQWSDNVAIATDVDRIRMHVGAVFVNNFTNHLFALIDEFYNEKALNFNLLYPLIEETIRRVKAGSPSSLQTGPAIRKDSETIEKHIALLKDKPELEELYKTLTNSIISFYDKRRALNNLT